MSQPPSSTPFLDANMSGQNPATVRPPPPQNPRARYLGFLVGLANIMIKRNTPLPPQLTGVPAPNYDPHTSPFKVIDLSNEVGHFRLAGRDIDVFKLWGSTQQAGGGSVSQYLIAQTRTNSCCSSATGSSLRASSACQTNYPNLMARVQRQLFTHFRRVMILS